MDVSSLPFPGSGTKSGRKLRTPDAHRPDAASSGGSPLDSTASLASLRQLHHFRSIAIVGQLTAVTVAYLTDVALPHLPVAAIIGSLLACNLYLGHRLRQGRPASHLEVFLHLSIDLVAFTGVLLLSGGAANPFVSVYFLHVALIGLMLPARLAVYGLLLALLACALCATFALPLQLVDGRPVPTSMMNAARWLSFALSAALIAWFVGRVSEALQAHQRLLAEAGRKALNDETMLRIGTIAAGAAHELATPLMSMSVIVREWERQPDAGPVQRDAKLLASQIAACKQALANLRAAAGEARAQEPVEQPVDHLLTHLARRCSDMRPGVQLRCELQGDRPAPTVAADAALEQAILILLNNAADASAHDVRMTGRWDDSELELMVCDRGTGIPTAKLTQLGRAFFTTKPPGKGTGLGLVLTMSTVERLGGSVNWSNQPEGGACARMRVPLSSLQRTAREGNK